MARHPQKSRTKLLMTLTVNLLPSPLLHYYFLSKSSEMQVVKGCFLYNVYRTKKILPSNVYSVTGLEIWWQMFYYLSTWGAWHEKLAGNKSSLLPTICSRKKHLIELYKVKGVKVFFQDALALFRLDILPKGQYFAP
jgi:hypothetical protein